MKNTRLEIQKVLDDYKNDKTSLNKSVNEILKIFITEKIEICPICQKTLIVGGDCPSCNILLCTPFEGVKL